MSQNKCFKKGFHNIKTAHEIHLCEWLHLMHLIQLVQQDDHTNSPMIGLYKSVRVGPHVIDSCFPEGIY